MTPEDAKARYEAEWPALNAAKEEATARGDAKGAKGRRQARRQALGELLQRYSARHVQQEPSTEGPVTAKMVRAGRDAWVEDEAFSMNLKNVYIAMRAAA